MKVCIAEKPSVAKEIAQVIGAKSRKDGYFEGNGYQVTWTFGHFCTLYPPEDYDSTWKRWDMRTLPMLPQKFQTKVMNDKGVKKQFKIIKSLFGKAEEVINCGDAGQEGELIQRWVMKEAGYSGPVRRLWISSLTADAIKEGFNLIHEKLNKTLGNAGLKKMEAKEDVFDADKHEAITNIPAPSDALKGKVVDVIEEGYYLNDKIIRFAKVVVGQ